MSKDYDDLRDFIAKHGTGCLTRDPQDPAILEDPRDKSRIMNIGTLIRPGNSTQELHDAARKISDILKANNIKAYVGVHKGAVDCGGVLILVEQTVPKSLGIRSEFNGVAVSLEMMSDLTPFMGKPSANKKPPTP